MKDIKQIYEEYFDTVKKYLYCLTRNENVSEELAQETFYRAIQKLHTFKNNCKISVWLCQIAKNLWYDELRKNKKIKNIDEKELQVLTVKNKIEDSVISSVEKLQLYKEIQKLDEQTRNVIYLRITGELSFKDIGNILKKTENWVRTIFYRGKEKLKGEILYERQTKL